MPTNGYRSFRYPAGSANVAFSAEQSDCCHMWKNRCTMSPVYESYGTCRPVIWNTVFGSASKLSMRVSGSAHGDGGSVGSAVQFVNPVKPEVRSARSWFNRTGDSV